MGWCEDDSNTFCNIGERDIDFLLLEELRCSDSFRRWFLEKPLKIMAIQLPSSGSVYHSVHRTGESTGETDLLVEVRGSSPAGIGVYGILIEDKIDAAFSNRTKCGSKQTDRYISEITKNVSMGKWIAAVLVLVAPRDYITSAGVSSFHATVSYEEICDWMKNEASKVQGDLKNRFEHKRQMLNAAINRWSRGWDRKADEKVSGIWGHYHKIASAEFPDVRMNYKGGEPPDSYTVSFGCLSRVEGLPKCRIDHVMERGTVDILVPGGAEHFVATFSRVDPALMPNMSLRRAGKSLGITIKVAPINRFGDVSAQSTAIREALQAVRNLKSWFEANIPLLRN